MKKMVLVALLCMAMIVPSMGQSGQQKKKYVFENGIRLPSVFTEGLF